MVRRARHVGGFPGNFCLSPDCLPNPLHVLIPLPSALCLRHATWLGAEAMKEETRAKRRWRRSTLWPRNVPVRENMAIKGQRFHSKAVMSLLKYVCLPSPFHWHCSFSWNYLSLSYPHLRQISLQLCMLGVRGTTGHLWVHTGLLVCIGKTHAAFTQSQAYLKVFCAKSTLTSKI